MSPAFGTIVALPHHTIPKTVTINKYATIIHGDYEAKNGYIHELDNPLIPPPSVLQSAHLFPQYLSTFVSFRCSLSIMTERQC